MPKPDPYEGIHPTDWLDRTRDLVGEYPLRPDEIVEVVLDCWRRILTTEIAGELRMGEEYTPSPQMMGNFLDSVVSATLARRYAGVWRENQAKHEKDLVYIPNDHFSTEIKTSSHKDQVFGNRSYAQPALAGTKERDGYYLTINFERFADRNPPEIRRIALGWLSHEDWIPQKSATGQQASIALNARRGKLLPIYP